MITQLVDAWLPIGFELLGARRTSRVVSYGHNWQIYEVEKQERVLITKEQLAERWITAGLLTAGALSPIIYGEERLVLLNGGFGRALELVSDAASPNDKQQAMARAHALRETREIDRLSSLHDAIYVERFARLLPTGSLSAPVEDAIVFGAWLTGGVPVSVRSSKRLSSLMGWIPPSELAAVLHTAGFDAPVSRTDHPHGQALASRRFELTGRPDLEQFLTDHVIDIIENEARYKALGIEFPSAIVLQGPPGSGKTYAAERLVDHLGWPSFSIEASTVASPYIHETSRKIAAIFDEAARSAPAIVIIDEMDAFLAERQAATTGQHHTEEVAEFLRRLAEAGKNRVLVIAMTNRIEMIDQAVLRRGRFDHVIKVDVASKSEVLALLQKLVLQLPRDGQIDLNAFAEKLAGRPLSDVSFVVRESARIAAKEGKSRIDHSSLLSALRSVEERGAAVKRDGKFGFV
jgi:adenylate kinase family enzyme